MGKAGTVLAIMSLIIGVSGVGIGVVSWITTSQLQEDYLDFKNDYSEPNIWYKEYVYNMLHWEDDYNTFEQLTIDFTVGENETMYFCYTGEATIHQQYKVESSVSVFFNIDGYHLDNPTVTVGVRDAASLWYYQSITLQFSTRVLSPGAHNVTIDLVSTYHDNMIGQNTLIVIAIPD